MNDMTDTTKTTQEDTMMSPAELGELAAKADNIRMEDDGKKQTHALQVLCYPTKRWATIRTFSTIKKAYEASSGIPNWMNLRVVEVR